MPRKMTSRIIDRKNMVYSFLMENGESSTPALVRQLDLTHSQTFYALRLLLRDKKIEEIKRGKIAYWRIVE